MRLVSDQICREHGLTTLKPYRQKKQVKGLRPGEYRSAMRGQSWKFQLIAVIEAAMERAGSREEFLDELRRRGYDARWEEGRKHITYITPSGMRCQDDKLHEEKFRKEKIEDEFRIRQRTAQHDLGQAETTDAAYVDRPAAQRSLHHADDDGGAAGGSPAEDLDLAGDHPGGYGETGNQGKSADDPGVGHRVGSGQHPDVAGAAVTGQIIHLLARLEGSEQQMPVQDSTTLPARMDRKAWAKERRHRMSRQEAEPEEGQKLL